MLHTAQTLLCTVTSITLHERFCKFQKQVWFGLVPAAAADWPTDGRKAFLNRFAKTKKNEPLAEEFELVNLNGMFARVRCSGSREVSVNLRDLAPSAEDIALRSAQGQRPPT